jgi:HEPN domain-containing protein
MSAEAKVASTLWLARDDAQDALLLAGKGRRNAAYHCEQAAEKFVKALLVWKGIDFPATEHRIDVLLECLPEDDEWMTQIESLEWLSAYATTYRYPSDAGNIKQPPESVRVTEEAKEVLALIDSLCEEACIVLTDDYDHPYKPVGGANGPSGRRK